MRQAILAVAVLSAACLPASWGAGALLHPSRKPLAAPRPEGAADFAFENDGLKLKGWHFRGQGPRRGIVVYLHGSADNRASGVGVAQRFLARGFDALAYDSRAHGESQGQFCTYGFHEKRDLSRALDQLPPQPVILFGNSLGAAVALQAAAEDRRISGVVAVATFSDLRTVATERAPFIATRDDIEAAFRLAGQQASFEVGQASPLRAAPRISVPVLLVHGDADVDTPPAHSQRVLAALGGPKRLILVPGAGHHDPLRPEVWREIEAWVDKLAR